MEYVMRGKLLQHLRDQVIRQSYLCTTFMMRKDIPHSLLFMLTHYTKKTHVHFPKYMAYTVYNVIQHYCQ